jgi:hypothetical protein
MVSPVSRATFLERMSMARTMRRIDFITFAASFLCVLVVSLKAHLRVGTRQCLHPTSFDLK